MRRTNPAPEPGSGLGCVATIGTEWQVVGQGDFNGDGKADILWRNDADGSTVIWEQNGGQVLVAEHSTSAYAPARLDRWPAIGDFDGDGKADIVWRNATNGNVASWLMNGTTVLTSSTATFGIMPLTWSVAGTGDFIGDGKSDILWRDTSGNTGDLGDERHHGPQSQQLRASASPADGLVAPP